MTADGKMKSTKNTLIKNALFVVLVLATAFVGVKLGMGSKGAVGEETSEFDKPPESNLTPGVNFPDVTVLDENGGSVQTTQLLGGKGGVVMFMDLSCPPCQEMCKKLETAFAQGLSDVPVVGITPYAPEHVMMYRHKNGVTFPMYSDTSYVFMSQYRVQNFPLLVIVGKSGVVRDFTFDARLPIDVDRIHDLIEE